MKEDKNIEAREKLIIENFQRVSKQLGMNISELDLTTYAKQMDSTENYPWTTYLSNDSDKYTNQKHIGNKKARVNNLSKERFETEFYKKYPKESTTIMTNIGELPFMGIKFNTNYSNYSLMFKDISSQMDSYIFIQYSRDGYYIDNESIEINQDSEQLVKDMLKYNIAAR